ncbi:3-beta hydroxysteroid dehydrogenase/isomerase family-domain-containing protein [Radiomyces spectabilis]|uniref:3-beta hydroxysteroid dehydrogenase/isomerase family-domain-containing protein n=1 Tax=Radiomyces spectabilis TaxID=64574 RepID=UPI0022209B9E|nr:3-beta hydroxysteroid dehydrogenase/isomerase family-domain-containing protein [Radiomyces spectabilis]KAI8364722.1 3-beta hydroxysteroid dehydrogenase/isomerase family-domain-containing protein [Radiomyces spectabilis]
MPHSYLVIGGNGFLGRHVQEQIRLRNDGSSIAVFDMVIPTEPEPDVKYFAGDLRNMDDVCTALQGITAVIHTASPPHVNSSNPPRDLYFSINVDGTQNIMNACKKMGVQILVVTSSGSVISTGEPMVNVDEHTPYPPVPIDVYTESKMECEKIVLAANDKMTLRTCTIRPSAIFGPGDRQLIPGMIEVCQRGQHRFQIGDNTSLMDFTYVGNVAYAHVLAAEKLVDTESPVAGQAFNLTNGTPVPFWDFASKVWAEYGCHMPNSKKIVLSYNASMIIALIGETIFSIKELFWDRSQLKEGLTRARIKQAMSSRYFNISKAKQLLGYEPQVGLEEGIKLSIEYYKAQHAAK